MRALTGPPSRRGGMVDALVSEASVREGVQVRLLSSVPTGCSAAWLARGVRDAEVAGSNPANPTMERWQSPADRAALLRQWPYGARGFKSRSLRSSRCNSSGQSRAF